ncbi:hypothetical protein KJ708_03500, partial [bacterium]|nr:hypothetical protein [bacterium]
KGYFPGSLEALPRQPFGAMMLLKRLPIELASIGTDKHPQSQTQPLEDDNEPQYLKVVHTFTQLMVQGSQKSLDVRSHYDLPYKFPYWPKPADEKTITITMERSHGNGEPRFIPFVRHASINGDLFDTTFMDQKTNNMTPSLRLQSAPGEPEIWHARHFGLPAVATGGAYGFEMAQGAQASVLFQYYQDEVEKASEIMGDAQIKSVLSRERLWPWLEKVLKVYAQKQGWVHPRVVFKKDYKKWIEAIEEVIKENFAYRKDMSSDLLHEVFEAGWDFSEQQLWQHCHHPRRVPTGKLAIGSDVEQSMIAIELMRFFGISCDYAFGIRLPNPFFYQQSTTIRTALVCQPLVRGKHAPGYVRDYRIALLQTQGDAEEPKVSNKQKTPLEQLKKGSRTWLRRLASAAVLAGGLVLMKSCVDYIPKIPLPLVDDDSANGFDIDLSKYLDFFKNSGVALLGNGERKPHTQPYPGDEGNPWRDGGFEKKQAVYTVDVGPLVSLPDYLGVGFSYDYSGRDSLEAYFLEGMEQTLVEHIFDRSWLEVEPTQAFVAMLSQVDEPRPMIGDRRRNQTYLIPEDSVKPYYQRNHEQSGNPEISDERLLEVAVPLSTISQNYDLSEAQSLSFEERIDWVKAQIAENMIYDRKPNLDPVHVDFVRDWDVDDSEQLIEYWEHIHSPERVLESKHPGQCLEIGFTAVQLGRALDIPMIYSSGYLVHSESESSGYTGLPHAQPLIVWQDASGQERMYPMMLPTEDFTRLSGEQNGQGIPKTNYTLILFSMLLVYWTERRRLKKRNEASYVLSRLLGQGDEKEETSLADINKVYQKLLREIPDDDFMPLHLQHSGFRAPKSTDAAVFKEAMIFMAQVTRDRPRGRDEPSLSDWDNFLRASFNTGTWNYSGNSNPPLFDEETLAARIQKRMIGYA